MVSASAKASNGTQPPARRQWAQPQRLIPLALLAAYVGARLVLAFSGKATEFWDTAAYAPRGDARDRGELVSFFGEAPRLWGTPGFYALFPDDLSRALAQFTVSTAAWLMLAWALWRGFTSLTARVFAVSTALVISLTSDVASWDFALLSEPLSISLGIAAFACFLLWHQSGSKIALISMTVAALWWTFTRPEIRLFTALLCLALAVIALADRGRRTKAIVSLGVLVLALGWATAISPVTEQHFPRFGASGLSLEEETFVFRLIHRVYPYPQVLASYRTDLGMPACPAVDASVVGNSGDLEGLRRTARAYETCPDLVAWVKDTSGTFSLSMLAQRPGVYFGATKKVARDTFTTGDFRYGQVTPILPAIVEDAIFPPKEVSVSVTAAALLASAGFAIVAGAWRRRRTLFVIVTATAAAQLVSQLAVLMYVSAELPRYGIQEVIFLRLCMIMLVALGIDALLSRETERPHPHRLT